MGCCPSGKTGVEKASFAESVTAEQGQKKNGSSWLTVRISDDVPIPEAAKESMLDVLGKLKDLEQWEEEIKSLKLGKPPKIHKSYESSDELHHNFRTFCKYGRADAVRMLLEGPARNFWCLHSSQRFQESGLVLAAKYGQHELVPMLVAAGAELDYPANGGTALHWACNSYSQENFARMEPRQVAVVQHLLQEGASLYGLDSVGKTRDPLLVATKRGSVPMILLLRAAGAEVTDEAKEEAKKWGGTVARALLSEEKTSVPYCPPQYWAHKGDSSVFEFVDEAAQIEQQFQHMLSETFKSVSTRDRRGVPPKSLQLKKVVRVENSRLWARYLNAKASLASRRPTGCTPIHKLDGDRHVRTSQALGDVAKRLDGHVAESYLFHGTSHAGAKAIADQGFRRTMAGCHAGAAFGRGCYFAEASSKADEYASQEGGLFVMLLCRVACGEMYRITKSDVLALSEALHSGKYDSVLADREASVGTYREFVMFDEECIYPEYVLTYERMASDGGGADRTS